jgi:hypothetical protein
MTTFNDVDVLLRELDPVDSDLLPDGRSVEAQALASSIVGRRPHRPLVLGLLAIVALVIVVAAPAFGIQHAILDLFGREDVQFEQTPATGTVDRHDFAQLYSDAPTPEMDPQVIEDQIRLAATFSVSGHQRQLWVAPTKKGGFCYLYEGLGGGCFQTPPPPDGVKLDGSFLLAPGATDPVMEKLAGIVFDARGNRLELTLEDGRSIPLRYVYVSAPIGAGFFRYNPSPAEQRVGHRPLTITLFDADGNNIATESIDWKKEAEAEARINALAPPRDR